MCYGLASLLFLFFAFRKIYSHPSLFAGLGCKPLEKGENLRIIDVPPPPQRNIALVFLSVSLPGKLWWVLLLFPPFISLNIMQYGSKSSYSCRTVLVLLSTEGSR